MANVAYVRVSTTHQNDDRQLEALKKYNIDKYFTEKVSAKSTNRPELQNLLAYVRKDDKVFIHDFSRLARSTKDLLDIVEQLTSKGVELVSIKESIDSSTATGKLMLTMIGAIAEFERTNLLERQREGIEIAKLNGKFKGRKEVDKPKNWDEVYGLYATRKITAQKAMELMDLKKNTFYKFIKEEKE